MESLLADKHIIVEKAGERQALYLPFFHKAEAEVAQALNRLVAVPCPKTDLNLDKALNEVEKRSRIQFSGQQRRAVRESLLKKILVITGGPGTGKTTIVKAVVDIFARGERTVLLAAPTGRAAKRLSEATAMEAKTIHRTLEYIPKQGKFRKDETHPLKGDALIIDEFSMVDLPLMYHLLKAVPHSMQLILVGDKDQLPSVGPGTLLRDIIASQRVEVVSLDEIFRQEKDSLIVLNAHRINQGEKPLQPEKGDKDSDFYFLYKEDESEAFELIMTLCSTRIPQKMNLHPLSPQIQVISPMYRGLVGVDNLNKELQKRLNPLSEGLKVGTGNSGFMIKSCRSGTIMIKRSSTAISGPSRILTSEITGSWWILKGGR